MKRTWKSGKHHLPALGFGAGSTTGLDWSGWYQNGVLFSSLFLYTNSTRDSSLSYPYTSLLFFSTQLPTSCLTIGLPFLLAAICLLPFFFRAFGGHLCYLQYSKDLHHTCNASTTFIPDATRARAHTLTRCAARNSFFFFFGNAQIEESTAVFRMEMPACISDTFRCRWNTCCC